MVEAVVRRLAHPDAPNVQAAFSSTDLLRVPGTDATLLINYRRLPQFLDVLFRPEAHGTIDQLTGLVTQGLLRVKLAGSRAELKGFSTPETTRGSLQPQLRGQPAQALGLSSVLSTRTAMLVFLAATPAGTWPTAAAGPDSLGRRAALDSLRATFGPGLALAYLAAASPGGRAGRLALVRCPAPARTAAWLARLRRLAGTSPAFSKVGPYEIHPTGFTEYDALGPLLASTLPHKTEATVQSPASALVDNYLVLGDEQTLNAYLADVAAARTWARTPAQVSFLSEGLPRTRLSVLIDTRNSWNALLGVLTEERRAGLLRNEALFKRFPQVAFQLVPPDNEAAPDAQYYTQLLLRHPNPGPATAQAAGGAANGRVLAFRHALMGLPTLLPALGTRVPAVVVQDSARLLHYVSAENAVLWSDTLGGPAVGRSLLPAGGGLPGGLLLGAGAQLHLLAADGRNVLPFPLHLPDTVHLADVRANPVAGEPARLLAVTAGNALLLLDARGHLFPGWQPKRLDFPLAGRPTLLNVSGRDVVVAPLQNGYVYAFDGEGSLLPGFPLSVGARLEGDSYAQVGSTLSRSHLTVVNQHGELVTFTLGGDVLSRRRVATWSRTAHFRLEPDPHGRSFAITREDNSQLDLYLPTLNDPLLTQRFVTSGERGVQWFDFGSGRHLVAITEAGPGQVFLYDARGWLLGREALPSTGTGVGLTYDATTDSYQLVRLVGRELRRTELKVGL